MVTRPVVRSPTEPVVRGAGSADVRAVTFGAEIIVNGAFAADTNWMKGAGWAIAAGVATRTNVGANSALSQAIALEVGATYEISYTVVTITSGAIQPRFGGGSTVFGTSVAAPGTYTEIFRAATGNVDFRLAGDTTFAGDVDNVVVRRLFR